MLALTVFAALLLPCHNRAGALHCTYDRAGRLVGVQYGSSTNLTYSYDPSGSIVQTSAQTLAGAGADLAVVQSTLPGMPVVGVSFRVVISAVNLTSTPAAGVRLDAEFPAGLVLLSASSTSGTCSIDGARLTCDIGSLQPGKDVAVEIVVRPGEKGEFPLTVTISSSGDPNPGNDSHTANIMVLLPPSIILRTNPVGGLAELVWPALVEGMVLEESTGLEPPVIWRPLGEPSLRGDTLRVQVFPGPGNRFFRLSLAP